MPVSEADDISDFFDKLEKGEWSSSGNSEILNIIWKCNEREEVIERLLALPINGKNCAEVISFAVELHMSAGSVKRLVERVSLLFSAFLPTDVPSIAYQLLNLCRLHQPFQVVQFLSGYYFKAFQQNEERNEGTKAYQELCNSRGMTIFHISRVGVAGDHPLVKDLLGFMKTNLNRPSAVLNLFMLEVILAVSSNNLYRVQIIDTLRQLIVRAVGNEKLRQESAWIADVLHEPVDPKNLINELVEKCTNEKDVMISGMELIGFALLEYKPPRTQPESVAKIIRNLGGRLLAKMVRKTPPAVNSVVSILLDHLAQSKGEEQFIDALSQLCIEVPLVLQLSHLQQVLQISVTLPVERGRLLLSSLYPVMRLNKQFRDAVLMCMRKSLSGRSLQHRQIAVAGLMQMLKFAKGLGPLSSTQASFFSQTQSFSGSFMEVHSTGGTQARPQDAVYAELFILFKRCLDQAAYPVKVDVYQGFTDVIVRNQSLVEPALELLVEHLKQYVRKIGEHTGIKLEKCFEKEDLEHSVREPLCFLLQTCIHLAAESSSQSLEEVENLRDDLNSILESLSSFLVDWDLGDWDLTESTVMNPATVEGRNGILKVKFIMSLYVPMMEKCILNEALTLRVKAEVLLTLYKKYRKLGEFLKDMQEKAKKKEKSKKDKEGDQNESNDIFKGSVQEYEGCAMSMKSLSSILQGLFAGGGGGHPAALDLLRSPEHRDFQTFILEIVLKISQHLKKTGRPVRGEHTHGDKLIMNVCKIARALFCVVVRPAIFNEPDLVQRVLAMESIGALAVYMEETHRMKLIHFLVALEGNDESPEGADVPSQALVALRYLQKFGERLVAAAGDNDAPTVRCLIGLFDLVRVFSRFLPSGSQQIQSIHKWYEAVCKDWDVSDGPATKVALTRLIRCQIRSKTKVDCLATLASQVHGLLGDIDEEAVLNTTEVWGIIKEGPRPQLVCILVDQLESVMENVTFVIGQMAIVDGEQAEKLDKAICARLHICQAAFNELVQTNVPEGVATDSLLKGLDKFFVCLSLYAKKHQGYVINRLEALVREIGQKLTHGIYEFFTFLGSRSKDSGAKRKKGGKSEAHKEKIIREARSIAALSASIEEAVKNLIKLGKKAKVDLSGLIRLATARDFRIRTENIEVEDETSDGEDSSIAGAPQSTPAATGSRKKQKTSRGSP